MIKSGRNRRTYPQKEYTENHSTRGARLTAILGAFVFTVFLCISAERGDSVQNVADTFGEGAYQVFASADAEASTEEDAAAIEDGSVWAYLESVIARLILGE